MKVDSSTPSRPLCRIVSHSVTLCSVKLSKTKQKILIKDYDRLQIHRPYVSNNGYASRNLTRAEFSTDCLPIITLRCPKTWLWIAIRADWKAIIKYRPLWLFLRTVLFEIRMKTKETRFLIKNVDNRPVSHRSMKIKNKKTVSGSEMSKYF